MDAEHCLRSRGLLLELRVTYKYVMEQQSIIVYKVLYTGNPRGATLHLTLTERVAGGHDRDFGGLPY